RSARCGPAWPPAPRRGACAGTCRRGRAGTAPPARPSRPAWPTRLVPGPRGSPGSQLALDALSEPPHDHVLGRSDERQQQGTTPPRRGLAEAEPAVLVDPLLRVRVSTAAVDGLGALVHAGHPVKREVLGEELAG